MSAFRSLRTSIFGLVRSVPGADVAYSASAGGEHFPRGNRRNFANARLDNRENLDTRKDVKDEVGHPSVNTTLRYDRRGKDR